MIYLDGLSLCGGVLFLFAGRSVFVVREHLRMQLFGPFEKLYVGLSGFFAHGFPYVSGCFADLAVIPLCSGLALFFGPVMRAEDQKRIGRAAYMILTLSAAIGASIVFRCAIVGFGRRVGSGDLVQSRGVNAEGRVQRAKIEIVDLLELCMGQFKQVSKIEVWTHTGK